MKITEISYSYKSTVQMRQFEPVEVAVFVKAQVDPSDKPESVLQNLRKMAKKEVDAEIENKKRERMESFTDELSMERTI